MSESEDQVGQILNPRDQICVLWEIENYFSSISQKADTIVTSPDFYFSNASWYIRLDPNGMRTDNSVGYINIFLKCTSPREEEKLIEFTLAIKCLDGYFKEFSSVYPFTNLCNNWGFIRFIERNELIRKKYNMVPGGTLTVVCKAKVQSSVKEVSSQTVSSESVSFLSEDLKNLFIDEKYSDVTVKVKGRRFRVHKGIFGSRSSVFSAMFEHEMKENTTGEVDIDDCEPENFQNFLLFLYTGKVEKLSLNNVEGLYYLADKYNLKDLTSTCLNFMKENLDLSNVCTVMALADRHHEEDLKKSASEMIKRNLKTLIPSSQWITFLTENPILASELLLQVLPDS